MTYNDLKQIAQPHIRENENLPSNSFLLLNQLHIPFKSEKQCEDDYKGKMTPLYNHPAFLSIDSSGEKTIYFNSNTRYWNFYIFHEIAHYILGHEDDCPQNEIDADMLACILAAPIENLPSTIKSARDLSSLCQIPIDKAEMYWQEIGNKITKKHKKHSVVIGVVIAIIILLTSLILVTTNFNASNSTKNNNSEENSVINSVPGTHTENPDDMFYMTSSGTHYHSKDCQYIKYKNNIIEILYEEVKKLNLKPCKECIN